tara:strand:+ start:359 stop:718 length:360 start_codon:yes stop_codon:yes gene_type:complete
MKKLTIIVAAILALSACKKEKKEIVITPVQYSIDGTWKLIQEVKDQTSYPVDSLEWVFNKTNCTIGLAPYSIDNTSSYVSFQSVNEDAVEASFTTYIQKNNSSSLELFRNDSTTLIFVR